jgi:hypothetical protein
MANKVEVASDANEDVTTYLREIDLYHQRSSDFRKRGDKIVKRYLDERTDSSLLTYTAKFNILWSNTQTLHPAVYAKQPVPIVERRFKDKDAVGRQASEVMERGLSYQMECGGFSQSMEQIVLDNLLPGRGTGWVRYVPKMRPVQVADNEPSVDDDGKPVEEVYDEMVCFDYVHWHDFGHNAGARTWDEVWCIWRKVYLTRGECVARFGKDIGSKIPLNYSPNGNTDTKGTGIYQPGNKAEIFEVWDKRRGKVSWISRGYQDPCDELDDPLGLPDFFPTPRPLYATLANKNLYPAAFFYEYQDQARELDVLTARITSMTKALKVAGVYDTSAEGMQRLLNEGTENMLIPVERWNKMKDAGGLAGAFELWPVDKIATTILSLYQARDQVKNDLYEISGMPDIIRGSSDPNETATAQKIKGQFGSMRLRKMQDDVQRYCRDLIGIAGDVIAKNFSLETLRAMSGVQLYTNDEKQKLQQQVQVWMQQQQTQPPQQGAPPPQPPVTPEQAEMLGEPSWEDVEALLKDNATRGFRIDIETDSTIGNDDEAEKEARLEFIKTAGALIGTAMQAAETTPELAPLSLEFVMFGLRAFKTGRTLEGSIETTLTALQKKLKGPQAPSKDDQAMQAAQQAQEAQIQGQIQIEKIKQQGASQLAQQKAQSDVQIANIKAQNEVTVENMRQDAQAQQVSAEKEHQAQLAQIEANLTRETEQMKAALQQQTAIQLETLKQQTAITIAQINAAAKVEAAELSSLPDPATADTFVAGEGV